MKRKSVKIDYCKLEKEGYKFGTGSVLLDGNSDYLPVPDHADWFFRSGSFLNIPDNCPIRLWSTASIVALNHHIIGA